MRDDHDLWARRGVTVLPISVDSIPTLKEYRHKHGFQVHMLSDFRRDVSRLYGVLLEEKYFSNRAYFLIDPTGTIRWEHVEHNASDRRMDAELFNAIDKMQVEAE